METEMMMKSMDIDRNGWGILSDFPTYKISIVSTKVDLKRTTAANTDKRHITNYSWNILMAHASRMHNDSDSNID